MKKKQKRYTTERAILADIYAAQRRQEALLLEAEGHDRNAKLLINASLEEPLEQTDIDELEWQKGLAAKARRAAERQSSVIAKLRATQDAFCTSVLPGMVKDDSVTIQKP